MLYDSIRNFCANQTRYNLPAQSSPTGQMIDLTFLQRVLSTLIVPFDIVKSRRKKSLTVVSAAGEISLFYVSWIYVVVFPSVLDSHVFLILCSEASNTTILLVILVISNWHVSTWLHIWPSFERGSWPNHDHQARTDAVPCVNTLYCNGHVCVRVWMYMKT